MRTCCVNTATGIVENVIERGGPLPPNCKEDTAPPPGLEWVAHETASVGWIKQNGELVNPAPPPPPPDPRLALDETERKACTIDAQILADLNRTPQEISDLIDSIFATWTVPQRTFMKRLTRIVIVAARQVLRNGT